MTQDIIVQHCEILLNFQNHSKVAIALGNLSVHYWILFEDEKDKQIIYGGDVCFELGLTSDVSNTYQVYV